MAIKKISNKKLKGFSLVEMILVVAISSIIALAVSQTFLSGAKSFEKSKGAQRNLEEGRSAMEMMAKNIRMSKFAGSADSSSILFLNTYDGSCISYQFDSGAKKLQVATDCAVTTEEGVATECGACSNYSVLVSDVTGNFDIDVTNRTTSLYSIGKATMSMTVGASTGSAQTLQTSVSFRDYEDILQ
jgi:prepilin-type N-terminal cleavage/methylation domain-containing protein